jgi:hypothetical protein
VSQRGGVEEKVVFGDPAETGGVSLTRWTRESLSGGLIAFLTPFLRRTVKTILLRIAGRYRLIIVLWPGSGPETQADDPPLGRVRRAAMG